jgi:hypothetical protein
MYPPANFLLFALDELKTADVCASGILTRSDPLHIILKRIILTGYPYKVNLILVITNLEKGETKNIISV